MTPAPLTWTTFLRRNLAWFARSHLLTLMGCAIAASVIIGSLVVGDSVRGSLREMALARLGPVVSALHNPDGFFRADLPSRLAQNLGAAPGQAALTALIQSPGVAARGNGTGGVHRVVVYGVDETRWPELAGWTGRFLEDGDAFVSRALALGLDVKPGDELVVRVPKGRALGLDSVLTSRDESVAALRLRVRGILGSAELGELSLRSVPAPPANIFVKLSRLQAATGLEGKANLLLATAHGPTAALPASLSASNLSSVLSRAWTLEDAEVVVRQVNVPGAGPKLEIGTPRVFLPEAVAGAALGLGGRPEPVITFLANLIRAGERSTPYSMVAAVDSALPERFGEDQILVNSWLAKDLQLQPGQTLELSYFVPDSGVRLQERTNQFRVAGVVPLEGRYADRTLMPEFPGLAEAESTRDWNTAFPLTYRIRDQDEKYWEEHRGTPKAFIRLSAGQRLWGNRFGSLTAVRLEPGPGLDVQSVRESLREKLRPSDFGLAFDPSRELALKGASESQDFGQLFIAFSLFLLVAALLLTGLLLQFTFERRAGEAGLLLAVGLPSARVRRSMMFEGAALACLGALAGTIGGPLFAQAMLWALSNLWTDAVGATRLTLHVSPATLLLGATAAVLVSCLAVWLALRRFTRRPARELLTEGVVENLDGRAGRWTAILGGIAVLGAAALAAGSALKGDLSPGAFFGVGALLLTGGLAAVSAWLSRLGLARAGRGLTWRELGIRSAARRRRRSLTTVALLASGCFLILAIGAFRMDALRDAGLKTSGTGGYAFIGESALPIPHDLSAVSGQESLGLDPALFNGTAVTPFRVRAGDEASCLNLNRAQRPTLVGVNPESLDGRFTFVSAATGFSREQGWKLLNPGAGASGEIPAIGDANSIKWALGKSVGDTLDYIDEQGRPFRVRLVGAIANSTLQGVLVIDENEFVKRFPSEGGHRLFYVDAPAPRAGSLVAAMSDVLRDYGFETTPAFQRLNEFNAVQNTYLGTFQLLGGLGLLLGSAGLGAVLLRNILERRGELAAMTATGFRTRRLRALVLWEHAGLLLAGILLGMLAAAVAVLPALLVPGTRPPFLLLGVTLAAVVLNGLLWTWIAARVALRGNLLAALRDE